MATKVSYRSKTDLVADAIKAMIHSGELETGAQLQQREIADSLGVSPTPVREALRRLEAEGFVESEPHRPATVIRPDKSDRYESALILGTLEGLGAELAAKKVTDDDIDALDGLNRQLAAAESASERMALDRDFHFKICEITESSVLLSQLNLLWRRIGTGRGWDIPVAEWVGQHQMIIDALSAGDCSEARDATSSHVLDGFRRMAAASINSSPQNQF